VADRASFIGYANLFDSRKSKANLGCSRIAANFTNLVLVKTRTKRLAVNWAIATQLPFLKACTSKLNVEVNCSEAYPLKTWISKLIIYTFI